jgi:hypothetical protein
MRLRFPVALIVTLLAAFLSVYSILASHNEGLASYQPRQQTSSPSQSDPISGAWDVSFFVNGKAHPSTFDLKLEGAKVTGTAFSDHTGPGTVRDGSWSEGKLSFTLDFKKHESIAVKGALKDGKLAGEFTTEGFTSDWEAKRKGL